MDAKELMIGDWLSLFQGYPDGSSCNVRVSYIGEYGEVGIEGCKEYTSANCNLLFPIPLTPEILEKNGFIKYNEVSDTPPYDKDEEGNMYYSFKGEHKFWGWWQPNNVYFIPVNAMIDLEIKYVHELQHALRLCGIDKDIEI